MGTRKKADTERGRTWEQLHADVDEAIARCLYLADSFEERGKHQLAEEYRERAKRYEKSRDTLDELQAICGGE